MKLLVCSDSHGDNESLDQLYKKHPNCDHYLHAGDSESDSNLIFPFVSIRGNCDYFSDFNEQIILNTPYGKLLMKHTPTVSFSFLKENDIKIFIHGHTHIRKFIQKDDVYIINPGSISYSRDGNELSYAIIDIAEKQIKVNFYQLNPNETTN